MAPWPGSYALQCRSRLAFQWAHPAPLQPLSPPPPPPPPLLLLLLLLLLSLLHLGLISPSIAAPLNSIGSGAGPGCTLRNSLQSEGRAPRPEPPEAPRAKALNPYLEPEPGIPQRSDLDPVLPGQSVAAFSVDTLAGPFSYDPAAQQRPLVALVLNPTDPFQRAMWAPWSLQMFLRQAPLAAVDYLFLPYVYGPAAATDMAFYCYSRLMAAAREVFGSNDTTDEDLRRRVLPHMHFSTTPATAVSPQVLRLLFKWTMDSAVLRARQAEGPPSSPSASPSQAASTAAQRGGGGGGSGGGDDDGDVEAPFGAAAADGGEAAAAAAAGEPGVTADGRGSGAQRGAGSIIEEEVSGGRGGGGSSGGAGRSGTPGEEPGVPPATAAAAAAAALNGPSQGGSIVSSSRRRRHRRRQLSVDDDGGSESSKTDAEWDAAGGGSGGGGGGNEWESKGRGDLREDHSSATATDDGLRIGRLDSWYGWLPSPATASPGPAPLVAWNDVASDRGDRGGGGGGDRGGAARQSPCGPIASADGGGRRLAGAWVVVANSSREGHADCKYGDVILNMQRAGALGVVFVASPGRDVELISPFDLDGNDGPELLYGSSEGGGGVPRWPPSAAAASRRGGQQKRGVSSGGEDEQPCIPATMVSYSDGLDLLELLGAAAADDASVEVEFDVKTVPTGWFAIDPWVGLAEAGWAQLPTLMHAGWTAWWHVYLSRLRDRLRELTDQAAADTVVINVFKGQPFPGPHGAAAAAILPRHLRRRGAAGVFRRLLLDFSLGCAGGPTDSSCPAWDHMVQLFACCDPSPDRARCRPCPTTLWRPEGPAAAAAEEGEEGRQEGRQAVLRCGLELGRWATPFRRRVGRWLTDVTPLMAALGDGGRCTFTVQTAPWADGNWTASLSLLFVRQQPSRTADLWHLRAGGEEEEDEDAVEDTRVLGRRMITATVATASTAAVRNLPATAHHLPGDERAAAAAAGTSIGEAVASAAAAKLVERGLWPVSVLPLFDSADFDASYNRDRRAVSFATPRAARAAVIVSYITGHGSDAAGCGEFCPTSHHLFVNGLELAVLNFTKAGTAWGCADAVLYGSVPNQHGTWLYGRGGWCDGAAVDPWIVDVSVALRPPASGANNTIWIKGLYGDRQDPVDPPEGTSAGYIMMQSVLVFYE